MNVQVLWVCSHMILSLFSTLSFEIPSYFCIVSETQTKETFFKEDGHNLQIDLIRPTPYKVSLQ